ncbi:hypothetical protein PS918_02676 [Pseudomonas fluorescens]|uniref:DUF6161 domain-containing protein n=1 Tax=Pseudomonas fluorescens TaxID=294 RepID=A0A5E7SEC5_PSEFL|nr:DUF6161 domain-containing protein [Pseudomonas fluorescens]VVP84886.1 hypothetical protein PS918_02676 [Pseudomonas fluorescens]
MTPDQESQIDDTSKFKTYDIASKSKREQFDKLNNEELHIWLSKEQNYWSEIDKTLKHQKSSNQIVATHSSVIESVTNYLNTLQRLNKTLESTALFSTPDSSQFDTSDLVSDLFDFDFPHHDDPLAGEFKNACHSGETASVLYTYRALSKHPEKHYLRGFDEGVSKNLKAVSGAVDNKAAETLAKIKTKEGELSEKIKSAEETISKIVEAATSAIALSEPVKFWDDRKNVHNINAKKYGKYASRSAVIFSTLLVLIVLYEYMSGVPHAVFGYEFTLPKTLSGIAIILLISTGGIWSTRIFVKLMMANLTMETESIERATMIKTFVAMKAAESSIAKEAELLFYTTLFRPSNNVISEDSTAPEFGKILDAILKTKPEKAAG